jgi:hypothetical protein
MQLRMFPKLVLFGLAIYATTGTYKWAIQSEVIPTPKAVATWTPADIKPGQKIIGIYRDGDLAAAAALWAWNAQSGYHSTLEVSPGFSKGEDQFFTFMSGADPIGPHNKPPFPISVAVSWGLIVIFGLFLALAPKLEYETEGEVYCILNGEELRR